MLRNAEKWKIIKIEEPLSEFQRFYLHGWINSNNNEICIKIRVKQRFFKFLIFP